MAVLNTIEGGANSGWYNIVNGSALVFDLHLRKLGIDFL